MAGAPMLPVIGKPGLRIAGEEDRFLECPICFLPMENIVFLGTMPDNPSQKWNSCRDGFCASCVRKALDKASQAGVVPTCALCRREIVSVIDGVDSVGRLITEYHKAQELRKEADGWRNIIATLNTQLKKAREDAAKQGGVDAEVAAASEREKNALRNEVAKLKTELAHMAKAVSAAEDQAKEKADIAKHALAELQKDKEEARQRIEEAKENCARQMMAKDRIIQQRSEEVAAHANALNAAKQEIKVLKEAAAMVQNNAIQELEKQLKSIEQELAAEKEETRKVVQQAQADVIATQEKAAAEKAALQQSMRSMTRQLEENVRALNAAVKAKEDALVHQRDEAAEKDVEMKRLRDEKEVEMKKLKDQVTLLTASLAQTKQHASSSSSSLLAAAADVEAKSREREADMKRKLDQMHADKTVIEGKLTSLSRRADQVAAIEKRAEEAAIAESALKQQLIDKSNQIFSLEQHNAALQTHIKELKGRVARMEGSSSRIIAPPPGSSSTVVPSSSSSATLNNSYIGMLSSSLSNTVASVSAAPLSSWWGGSTRTRGFIKTASDYHKFSHEKHTSLARFAFPTCRGQDITAGSHVFVCRVRVNKTVPSVALYREMMYSATLRHQNILRLDGVIREKLTENDFLLELALAPFVEESLEDAIRTLRFSPADVRSMFHQILSMVHYMHSAGLVLRSFNPSQLVFSPRDCIVKLGVLSSVRSLHSLPFDPLPPSSLHYLPPELLYTSTHSPAINWKAADCWSIGCVFSEILLGRPLFDGCKDSIAVLRRAISIPSLRPKTFDEVVIGQLPLLTAAADSPSHLSSLPSIQLVELLPDAGAAEIDLIARLMCLVPQFRISVKQALDHACFPAGQFSGAVESGLGTELADDQIMKWIESVGLFK